MMKTSSLCRRTLLVAFFGCVTFACNAAAPTGPFPHFKGENPASVPQYDPPSRVLQLSDEPSRFIVRFKEAPLALYAGSDPAFAAPPRLTRGGRSRLDVHSVAAKAYVSHLRELQDERIGALATELGRSIQTQFRFQHALNAVVVTLNPKEVAQVAKIDGVESIRLDALQSLTTDIGPGFIGASSAWWGASAGQDTLLASGFDNAGGVFGEGIVVGVVDSGYNSASPSFAATDDFGYAAQNPLGPGQFLGQCDVPGISTAGCNDKVIGVYDFVSELFNLPLSVEDLDGHGSHTASTAAGNRRKIDGYTGNMSGVAPHANLVIYRACFYTDCYESSLVSAFDQVIQDTVVDVVNYSISGGITPWDDPVSLAMLSATEAGVFIAAAAGNGDQKAGSANHVEPWTTTVAASTHTGAGTYHFITIADAPDLGPWFAVPAIQSANADGGLSTVAKKSPNYGGEGDGCDAYPMGTFDGAMALIKIGAPCNEYEIVANAVAAGAQSVLLIANGDFLFGTYVFASIPVLIVEQTTGDAIADHVEQHPAALVDVGAIFRATDNPDVLAGFSLIGPAAFNVVKPDVQAPGQYILAAVAAGDWPDGEKAVGLLSGTSMAAPHTAGAAALVRDAHPEWTPAEVKSALMMTAKQAGLRKPDLSAPSDAFDRGAGRIQVDAAIRSGLVLDESGLAYLSANPASDGDPSSLNLASLTNDACITVTGGDTSEKRCAFKRKVRNTQSRDVQWTVSVTGVDANVSPAQFTIGAHDSRLLDIAVDASGIAADGIYRFGELVLTPSDDSLSPLHMPIAVRMPAPNLSAPTQLDIVFQGNNGETTVDIANTGGPTLNVASTNLVDASPVYPIIIADQTEPGEAGWVLTATNASTLNRGNYAADDFHISDPGHTDLGHLFVRGQVSMFVDIDSDPIVFYPGHTPLANLTGQKIQFAIYPDLDGVPAGGPPPGPVPNNPPVWSFTATIGTTAGLELENDNVGLDLEAAGASPTALPPGRYWLVVHVEEDIYTQGIWGVVSSSQRGDDVLGFFNTISTVTPMTAWLAEPGLLAFQGIDGLQFRLETRVACGAPWLSTTPADLTLPGLIAAPVTVKVDASLFPDNETTASAYLCVESNDADTPVHVVKVTATQQN